MTSKTGGTGERKKSGWSGSVRVRRRRDPSLPGYRHNGPARGGFVILSTPREGRSQPLLTLYLDNVELCHICRYCNCVKWLLTLGESFLGRSMRRDLTRYVCVDVSVYCMVLHYSLIFRCGYFPEKLAELMLT